MGFYAVFWVANKLHKPTAIAQINENHAAVIAVGIHPTAHTHLLADICCAKLCIIMCPQDFVLFCVIFGRFLKSKIIAFLSEKLVKI